MQLVLAAGCCGQGPQPVSPFAAISSDHLPDPADSPPSAFTEAFALLERSKERPPCWFKKCVCVRGVSTCLLAGFCRTAAFLFINEASQM